ncbi:substrate-binding periplasmic protein [Pseudomonas typographi]|uniref:substrate-binding periplasmic protein n=1 Tax=Pseudomonas typographi TaxID=2715964 RepID=UPI00168916F5|nr:transporter substrate-binding domain-containing protein [Pseudomonas typographi]MBD1549891.1 transporter substrate-binding domain-containing protein [Pseudomonas typographi]
MWRLLRGYYLLLVLLGLAAPTAAQTLRLVADPWPPFTDEKNAGKGLATEIVSQALGRAGYATTYEQVPWARALQGIETGRYDVLVDAWYNEARTRAGKFSQPYWVNRIRLLASRTAKIAFDGQLSQLYGYSIAVVRDYAYSAAFDTDDALHKVPVRNFAQGLSMLLAGRVDMALEDEYVARYCLRWEPLRDQVRFVGPPLSENPLHILVSRKNPDFPKIVDAFDQAIAQMKVDGSIDRLIEAHGL